MYTSKIVFWTHTELTMPAQYMSETLFWSLLNVAQIHLICVKLCQISCLCLSLSLFLCFSLCGSADWLSTPRKKICKVTELLPGSGACLPQRRLHSKRERGREREAFTLSLPSITSALLPSREGLYAEKRARRLTPRW